MEYRRIGASSLSVSVTGLGCNNLGGRLDAEGSRRVIEHAIDQGISFFDTADSYGVDGSSERLLGEALGSKRKQVVIATKFGWPLDDSGQRQGASRRYILCAVEESLRRLRTDWIDLYQMHQHDPATPIDETLRALDDLVRDGKVRFFGCSGLTPSQLVEADVARHEAGIEGFVSCQHHYNLLTRGIEHEVIPCLEKLGMSLLPYAPLASGLLTGKYRRDAMPAEGRLTKSPKQAERYLSDENWSKMETLSEYATRHGKTLLDLAAAWVVAHPLVCSVIAGAMTPEQVDANVRAVSWSLSSVEMAEIDALAIATTTP